jgi:hypothetical protein
MLDLTHELCCNESVATSRTIETRASPWLHSLDSVAYLLVILSVHAFMRSSLPKVAKSITRKAEFTKNGTQKLLNEFFSSCVSKRRC